MLSSECAAHFLERDQLLHIDMLECIRRGNATCLYVGERGVLLRDEPSGTFMLSAETKAVVEECLPLMQGAELLVCHQEFYEEFVSEELGLSLGERCHQAAYFKQTFLPETEQEGQVRPLDESYQLFVQEHYQMVTDEDYIKGRLRSGTMYGMFIDGKPVGFIGMHAEGSLGLLEILPEYRRCGLAFALESYAINRMLEKGWTPYGQIILGNAASTSLQQKLGLSISKQTCYWLSR